jgi:hypothetical protein
MSVQAIHWAFNQNIKRSSAKILLLALADYANETFIAYPSFKTLQVKCSCARSTINESIIFLKSEGYIENVTSKHIPQTVNKGQSCYRLIASKNECNISNPQKPKENQIQTDVKEKVVRKSYQSENTTSTDSDENWYENTTRSGTKIGTKPPCTTNKPSCIKKENTKEKSNLINSLDLTLQDLFQEFLALRKSLKVQNSDYAIQLIINVLKQFSVSEQKAMLEKSIMHSWKSVYPPSQTKAVNDQFQPMKRQVFNQKYYSSGDIPDDLKAYAVCSG